MKKLTQKSTALNVMTFLKSKYFTLYLGSIDLFYILFK